MPGWKKEPLEGFRSAAVTGSRVWPGQPKKGNIKKMSSIRHFDNCTNEQHEQLLNWFFYRINPEQRQELRAALPQAYGRFHRQNRCGEQHQLGGYGSRRCRPVRTVGGWGA